MIKPAGIREFDKAIRNAKIIF